MSGDMKQVIIPKSDQLNADDLISGPLTVKITGVTIRPGTEQPISISYEGDNNKPYKACKSMCRVMVTAWGADSKKYAGRSMTLYRDASVKWGGMDVGGIRISHMSDIDSSITMALTVTRANKKPFTVRPLEVVNDEPPALITAEQTAELENLLKDNAFVSLERFLKKSQVAKIADLDVSKFAKAKEWVLAQGAA